MSESQPTFLAENLGDILMKHRPSIQKLWPEVFCNLEPATIIEICGESGAGKSMFLMELMARTITRGSEPTSDEEKQPEVIFFDTEQTFNILKFTEIVMKMQPPDQNSNHIKNQLKKILIYQLIKDTASTIISKLISILSLNNNVALVVIDSLGLFYYSEAYAEQRSITKENYVCSQHEKLLNLARRFNVSFAYSLPDFLCSQSKSQHREGNNFSISLAKLKNNLHKMKIETKNSENELAFMIDFYGVRIVDHRDKN